MSLNFEYGDQISLQGISELYNVQIIIVSTMNHGTTLIRPDGSSILTRDLPIITLGHFPEGGDEHYVALEYDSNTIRKIIQESTHIYEEHKLSNDDTIKSDYVETSDTANLQSDIGISHNDNFDNSETESMIKENGTSKLDDNSSTGNMHSNNSASSRENNDNRQHVYTRNINNDEFSLRSCHHLLKICDVDEDQRVDSSLQTYPYWCKLK
jgi:hypothetical protein